MTLLQRMAATAVLAVVFATPASGRAESSASGFRSTGTLVVRATISGSPLDVGGKIALYRRGSFYRLDLLSLGFPGTDATLSAAAGALLVPGGATLLYDGATGTVSAYSNGNRAYYEDASPAPAGQRTASPSPAPTPLAAGAADPLAALATVVRQLTDVQRAAILFTGHSTTNGHATDDLDVTVRRQRPGKALEDYHAQLSLADDLDGFPVRILLSSTPATPQDFGGSLRLDLTTISRDNPADSIFTIPPGYTRVTTLGAVLQAH
jgi:hypothetical protein